MKQETSQWGKAVKKAVIDHDMTLKQLAEKIGYSNATVSQVVNGRYSNSSYKVIAEKINEVLGTEGLPERTETPSDEWCQTVKVELVKQSMTVNELAKQLDVSRDRLSLVINGKMMNEAKKEDSKVRKTKKLLSSYRRIKATLSDGEQFTPEEQAELRWKFIEDLMGNTREIAGKSERTIKDTERKREEDLYCVFRIEKATEMYREECEKSGSEEAKRRYRELSMMYLDEKPYTVQEISEVENISDKTVYKDIGIACGIVAIYLLGADF